LGEKGGSRHPNFQNRFQVGGGRKGGVRRVKVKEVLKLWQSEAKKKKKKKKKKTNQNQSKIQRGPVGKRAQERAHTVKPN